MFFLLNGCKSPPRSPRVEVFRLDRQKSLIQELVDSLPERVEVFSSEPVLVFFRLNGCKSSPRSCWKLSQKSGGLIQHQNLALCSFYWLGANHPQEWRSSPQEWRSSHQNQSLCSFIWMVINSLQDLVESFPRRVEVVIGGPTTRCYALDVPLFGHLGPQRYWTPLLWNGLLIFMPFFSSFWLNG